MSKTEIGISDEAVRKATGRNWDEWKAVLDDAGAAEMTHKEIVALLRDRGLVESAWWRQGVTNAYEKMIGRRTLGETQDADFQIGVQRTVDAPLEAAWAALISPEGVAAWLGESPGLRLEKGETYELADGATGEVRVVRPESHVRITWQPGDWPRPSTIQVRVTAKGERAVIGFHEEHLPDADAREQRRAHFKAAADVIKRLLEAERA